MDSPDFFCMTFKFGDLVVAVALELPQPILMYEIADLQYRDHCTLVELLCTAPIQSYEKVIDYSPPPLWESEDLSNVTWRQWIIIMAFCLNHSDCMYMYSTNWFPFTCFRKVFAIHCFWGYIAAYWKIMMTCSWQGINTPPQYVRDIYYKFK